MKITVKDAKAIRDNFGATHLVIFAIDPDGTQHVATHGQTRQHAQEAAKAGNKLKAALGWPDDLCAARPVERICKNCVYYNPDYGIHCFNGWTGDGSRGECMAEPIRVKVARDETCRHFEPNA